MEILDKEKGGLYYEQQNFRLYGTGCYRYRCGKLGLIGFFRFNLVTFLFGDMTWISRIIYALVGICGLYLLSLFGRVSSFSDDTERL